MEEAKMILVTGGTGRTGSEVVRALLARGAEVRLYVRDAGKARQLFGEDVELATGGVSEALDGAEALFLSFADDPTRVVWETRVIDAAGSRRIVRLSTIGAAPESPVAFWDWHGRVDEHLRGSEARWTIVQSSFYMSNVRAMLQDGKLFAPAGDARVAMIDPRDVGAAAAALLVDGGHEHETVLVTGPTAVTFADAASACGGEFVDVPEEAAPPHFLPLFRALREGAASQVTDTVERLTGSPPHSLVEFVRATEVLVG
jgi:uncharacterized protein YbjT (DUF2867 family)